MSGTLPLSSHIASLDRAGLMRLVASRRIGTPRSVNDPLDLAQELLKSDSIALALTQLTRHELGELAAIAGLMDRAPADQPVSLLERALVVPGPAALPEVVEVLRAELAARGVTPAALADPPREDARPEATDVAPDTSGWYAQALTTTAQVAWLLRDLTRTPAKRNRNGEVASAWVKGIEERLSIPGGAELIGLVRAAGLAGPAFQGFVAHGDAWLTSGHEARWIALARTAVSQMPGGLLELLRAESIAPGTPLTNTINAFPAHYPLITDETLAEVSHAVALWERLGITVRGHLSEGGAAVLGEHAGTDIGLPATAPGVYIQPDLSVVVPGPLDVADESALAAITVPEQLGVASTLRITETSVGDAIDRGFEVRAIRDLLTRLSISGIPQPLDYLITSLGERSGSVIVTPNYSEHGRSRIDFANTALRSSILVDRRLAHLQLHDAEGSPLTESAVAPLYSKLRGDHVLAALLDARYPAKAESLESDDDTRPIHLPGSLRSRSDAGSAGEADDAASTDPLEALVDRVLDSSADSPSDISRQVTLAIRDKTSIKVTVEIRGEVRDFTIVPVSLAAGRMRALDEAAGVERTLPLEAITAVAQLT